MKIERIQRHYTAIIKMKPATGVCAISIEHSTTDYMSIALQTVVSVDNQAVGAPTKDRDGHYRMVTALRKRDVMELIRELHRVHDTMDDPTS